MYRLNALPVGTYDLAVELAGFANVDARASSSTSARPSTVRFRDEGRDARRRPSRSPAESPLIESTVSSVGGVVDIGRIESIPLNGRQFANLAATLPGVGLGNHSDPTKSTQYSPQINGGNGRNVNYQIDGGDNNDDTVGGLLQLFPLEAIQEFNFVTSRSKAENGRSNGGVMNIVTKSGTNTLRGSFFELFRDTAMNAHDDHREEQQHRQAGLPPQSVRRQLRRPDRQGQDALLRRGGADAAGHVPGRQHQGPVPDARRRLRHALPRDAAQHQGDGQRHPRPVPVGALRPQPELAALRRRRRPRAERLGRRARTSSTRSTSTTTGCSAARQAERVHLPVRRLLERHHRQQHRSVPAVPERRRRRPEPEHAADARSRRSGSSATTSPGTSPAWAASATT